MLTIKNEKFLEEIESDLQKITEKIDNMGMISNDKTLDMKLNSIWQQLAYTIKFIKSIKNVKKTKF